MTPGDLDQCLTAAQDAARQAGALLAEYRSKMSVRAKGRADLVTDADEAAQQLIRGILAKQFPQFHFLGEEGPAGQQLKPGDPPTWIVDPIDGTTNYIHDLPLYCVSIGLWADSEQVLGVVYDPRHDEMFWAATGRGAWLGERRLHVSETSKLEDALLAVGFPADPGGHEEQLRWWAHFTEQCRGLRRTGSSALNLAYVAAGRFDAFFALGNKIWDIAAGVVLVREAGGVVSRFRDENFNESGSELLAASVAIHTGMQFEFKS
ncbi:MAG: inositol monophosphatase family protein [Gemmataceae bacterium]